ncbi:hypothetical protein B0T25DRAFT_141889 [Lasiosphaeria hispida]|uniref:Uncharacterized protein n=1 Tax=Lasiosphaeria hispida TaxID=260671 RepID=A0AAJ0HLF4_9PEZI|nr:hypothetical protein B0T25DRAFT_141889 [Lasiosphaeria hispida]
MQPLGRGTSVRGGLNPSALSLHSTFADCCWLLLEPIGPKEERGLSVSCALLGFLVDFWRILEEQLARPLPHTDRQRRLGFVGTFSSGLGQWTRLHRLSSLRRAGAGASKLACPSACNAPVSPYRSISDSTSVLARCVRRVHRAAIQYQNAHPPNVPM